MTKFNLISLALALVVAGASANAAGPDFSAITGAIDLASVGVAVLAIAALLAVPLVAKKGARMVLGMIGR